MTITIELPDEQARQVTQEAARLNMTVEDLAVRRLLASEATQDGDASDEEFEAAMEYVFQKNSELYRRLA